MRTRFSLIFTLSLLLICACDDPSDPAIWTVDPTPVVSIGIREGDPAYMLNSVTDVVVLSDGRIVVANSGDHEIRAYDETGRHLWSRGREGDGPGEFRGELALALIPGDTLVVYDWLSRRFTTLAADGSVAATASLPETLPNLDLLGAFGDGTLVMTARHLRLAPGLNADSVSYHRIARDGTPLDFLGAFPGSRVFFLDTGGMPAVEDQPFSATTSAHVTGQAVHVATGEGPTVFRVTTGGDIRAIRWEAEPRPVTAAMVASWRERHIESSTLPRSVRMRWQEAVPIPDHLPYADRLLLDEAGRYWVRQSAPPGGEAGWVVVESVGPGSSGTEGRIVAEVVLPRGLDPTVLLGNRLVGIHRDQLDVERVRVHLVQKGGAATGDREN